MDINFMNYVSTQTIILIPVLYVLGMMLKGSNLKDYLIPWVLLLASTMGSIAIVGFNVNAIIQGFLLTGVVVYSNQLIKQTVVKREQDK